LLEQLTVLVVSDLQGHPRSIIFMSFESLAGKVTVGLVKVTAAYHRVYDDVTCGLTVFTIIFTFESQYVTFYQ